MKRALLMLILLLTASAALAQTTQGTWTLYPGQTQTWVANVQQPINPDGGSVWSANKGIVPVQFKMAKGYGPVVFASMKSGSPVHSYLSFAPSSNITFDQLTTLSAVYTFTTGNCQGGSLRWSVTLDNDKSIFIYYGDTPNFTDCNTNSQSGANMVNLSDQRYDTTQVDGTFYDNYGDAVTLASGHFVTSVSLVLDSGWLDDQVLTLGNVYVNDNKYTPPSASDPVATCDLPAANIEVDVLAASPSGAIDEATVMGQQDSGTAYRIIDCKYQYLLPAKSLGVGNYEVKVLINNSAATGTGHFQLK